jgi:uncharacterized membrane protein
MSKVAVKKFTALFVLYFPTKLFLINLLSILGVLPVSLILSFLLENVATVRSKAIPVTGRGGP